MPTQDWDLNRDQFRGFFFKLKKAHLSLPSSNAIHRRPLQTLHREHTDIAIGTKMGNAGPETEMNCYSLVVKGEWPDIFCPLPSSSMQNKHTSSRSQTQAAEHTSTVLCPCPCVPVTTGLCPALLWLQCLQHGRESLCPALHLAQERKAKQLYTYGK